MQNRFVTSKKFKLPNIDNLVYFNMWQKKLWPYDELIINDILYWYEQPTGMLVWKSVVTNVDRFEYTIKKDVEDRLKKFGNFAKDEYYENASEEGYCLAYIVSPIARLALPKPTGFKLPQLGWLREKQIPSSWKV